EQRLRCEAAGGDAPQSLVPQPDERDRKASLRPAEPLASVRPVVLRDPPTAVRPALVQRLAPPRAVGGIARPGDELRRGQLPWRRSSPGRRRRAPQSPGGSRPG